MTLLKKNEATQTKVQMKPFNIVFGTLENCKSTISPLPVKQTVKVLPVTIKVGDIVYNATGHFVEKESYRPNEKAYAKAPYHSFDVDMFEKRFICKGSKNGTEWVVEITTIPKHSTRGTLLGEGHGDTCEEAMIRACKNYAAKLNDEVTKLKQKIDFWEPEWY